ncbi:MAG: trans-2-enoyl-CoA reductase family protein [Ruminococcus sp.]|nr:trans-2-enoyl-CoA reductase family protein [Ruminococcus sp.]MCM1479193.1 trans-2-enoyl-CoA reductase family protein [Muribaculaceae bacterium]
MTVKPKIRGFICTTAHPVGCREIVKSQIEYVKSKGKIGGPKKVLVIGASMGYGLASRISAAYGCGAATVGVIFDKQGSDSRTASAGWYNTAAFEEFAHGDGLYAKTVNGDAFSQQVKDEVIALIKKDLGKVDMVVYSLAAPRRTTSDGTVYSSVLKTVGEDFTNKSIDLKTETVSRVTITPATEEEIFATVKVMGGEDWKEWIGALKSAGAIEDGAVTVAYSYIGPTLTHPIYKNGSIGRAKDHLAATAKEITKTIDGVSAYVSVNKALVTQSSSAIPVVPLYISILYKVMKETGLHEGCIEQMQRLFAEKLFGDGVKTDGDGLIRLDDLEMREDVQQKVGEIWENISDENLREYADLEGYKKDFAMLFGFEAAGVDYEADCDTAIGIDSIG